MKLQNSPVFIITTSLISVYAENTVNNYEAYNSLAYGTSPNQTYKSSPLVAPLFQVTTWDTSAVDAAPYLFMSTLSNVANSTPATYIFRSSDLSLVYANPTPADLPYGGTTANVRSQILNNQTYLTYWRGPNVGGSSSRGCGFYNYRYELVYDLNPIGFPPEVVIDIHECQVTKDNTVIISIYAARPIDATSVGGPVNGSLIDSIFQEIDPVSNKLLFTWAAIDHFEITDSVIPYAVTTTSGATGWDWAHLNSVEKTAEGNFVVSFRHLSTISYHDGKTGAPVWILGGKKNQFSDLSGGNATNFAFQHDARFRSSDLGLLSLFDNQDGDNSIDCVANCSRGVLLDLDYKEMTARVVREYWHPASIQSDAMGNYGQLSNGNVIIGWGLNPAFTEHKEDGECVFDVQFAPWPANNGGSGNANYRIYKDHWKAYPTWAPALVVEDGMAFVSWNGATEVTHWAVFTGSSADTLEQTLIVEKRGFETSIAIDGAKFVRVTGLNRAGQGLPHGESPLVEV